ncbi:MAG: glycosyltransferase [Actinomycetota bacterium]|nr:glycosyltransferase [Actinomycetota bacterium]
MPEPRPETRTAAGRDGPLQAAAPFPPGVAVVVPAKDEARRVAATVRAAAKIPGVDVVVVVDDGSSDGTSVVAREAGAVVVRHPRNRGKAAAMETGAQVVAVLDQHDGLRSPRALLFLDADLEDSAVAAAPLVEPLFQGAADMTVAVLAPQRQAGGGRGLVVRLARDGIARETGFAATQPLSGQRCLTRSAFEAARPLAAGFGVETGLTIDLLRKGMRVVEVDCDLYHRVTGSDLRSQLHRARQYRDVARALAARRMPERLRRRVRR